MLDVLFTSFATHPTTWALGAAYFFTGAINALPEPGTNLPASTLMYHWLYDFLHVLSNRVQHRYPQTAPDTTSTTTTTMSSTSVPKP